MPSLNAFTAASLQADIRFVLRLAIPAGRMARAGAERAGASVVDGV